MQIQKQAIAFLIPCMATFVQESFAQESVSLREPEDRKIEETLEISRKWMKGGETPDAVGGENGSTVFFFGRSSPTIVCAVLKVCDLALEVGESVNDVRIGDSVRWNLEPGFSGSGANLRSHVLIKPLLTNIETSMVITTSKRAYHIRLLARENDYMPHVQFRYPKQEQRIAWQKIQERLAEKKTKLAEEKVFKIPETNDDVRNLDFAYKIKGKASWRPLRVYNTGTKTIIEFPDSLTNQDAPVLIAISKVGWFRKTKKQINYRISGNKYIVDSLFDRAVLISGVGRHQERVQIRRTNAK